MIDLFLILALALLGTIIGCVTGLIPGLHVNTIALLLLSAAPRISQPFHSFGNVSIMLSSLIVAASITHTFLNIIPSTFIGAPEEDTALVLLPAHAMLLEGNGYKAISLSAIGSLGAILFSFLILFPFRLLLGSPFHFYPILKSIIPWILLAISILLVVTEKSVKHITSALAIFFLSGIFGATIFDLSLSSPIHAPASPLFPALAGLFGMPTLLLSLKERQIPPQHIKDAEVDVVEASKGIGIGTASGSMVSILPGVTSAVATIIALVARGKRKKEDIIVTLSSVNTANAFFVVLALFVIERARSGVALAIQELESIIQWNDAIPPPALCFFFIAIIVASAIAYYATKFFGKTIAKNISSIPYPLLGKITIGALSFLVFIFTGLTGICIFIVATFIGLFCLELRVRRSVCMGVLLLPIMLTYFL